MQYQPFQNSNNFSCLVSLSSSHLMCLSLSQNHLRRKAEMLYIHLWRQPRACRCFVSPELPPRKVGTQTKGRHARTSAPTGVENLNFVTNQVLFLFPWVPSGLPSFAFDHSYILSVPGHRPSVVTVPRSSPASTFSVGGKRGYVQALVPGDLSATD